MQRSAKAVKKLIAGAVTIAVLATLFVTSEPIHGQQSVGASAGPHKIGLIDMAEVFKEYEKFKTLRESLQTEIEKSESVAKGMIEDHEESCRKPRQADSTSRTVRSSSSLNSR